LFGHPARPSSVRRTAGLIASGPQNRFSGAESKGSKANTLSAPRRPPRVHSRRFCGLGCLASNADRLPSGPKRRCRPGMPIEACPPRSGARPRFVAAWRFRGASADYGQCRRRRYAPYLYKNPLLRRARNFDPRRPGAHAGTGTKRTVSRAPWGRQIDGYHSRADLASPSSEGALEDDRRAVPEWRPRRGRGSVPSSPGRPGLASINQPCLIGCHRAFP